MPVRRVRFWRPESTSITHMVRVEGEDRLRVSYGEYFHAVVILGGSFDGWYRGMVRTQVPGGLKLKEPGEVHRQVRVHAPFTLEAVAFEPAAVHGAADAMGLRGSLRFEASGFAPGTPQARLAYAMHAALVTPGTPELERETRIADALAALLRGDASSTDARPERRAPRPVRRARDYLHDALNEKVTLEELSRHAGLDKFHLVRAFKAEVGVPPYEYLLHARVARARELLQRGERVAEAAQAVGFCDESQLHRHFRRIVGLAPGAFARSFGGPRRRSQHRPIGGRALDASSSHEETQPY